MESTLIRLNTATIIELSGVTLGIAGLQEQVRANVQVKNATFAEGYVEG